MQTLFATSSMHPRDRFDAWHSIACRTIVHHAAKPDCRLDFTAELKAAALGELDLILFETAPMAITHSLEHIREATSDVLFVCRQMAGSLALEQDGRELHFKPGDVTLIDPRRPYAGKFFSGSRLLVMKTPRRLLEARIGQTSGLTARAIRPSAAEHALLSRYLAVLPDLAIGIGASSAAFLAAQALDLIALSFGQAMAAGWQCLSSSRTLSLLRVRAAIEAHLTDPALDASTVAREARLSLRYANALLAEEGGSITRLIQERRLTRCRKALEDPAQAHRTISDIAYGWGFSDMTHFGRRFKAAYGFSPRDYRRQVLAAASSTEPIG